MEVKLLLVGGNVEWGNSFPTSEEEIDIPNFYTIFLLSVSDVNVDPLRDWTRVDPQCRHIQFSINLHPCLKYYQSVQKLGHLQFYNQKMSHEILLLNNYYNAMQQSLIFRRNLCNPIPNALCLTM